MRRALEKTRKHGLEWPRQSFIGRSYYKDLEERKSRDDGERARDRQVSCDGRAAHGDACERDGNGGEWHCM